MNEKSYFDGGLLQLIGYKILGFFITFITLGICYPWACCMVYNWEIKHTVINGKRLKFNGTATQLFGNWIKWLLLCIITLGIYSFWMKIALKKWKTKHTYFKDEKTSDEKFVVAEKEPTNRKIKKEKDDESFSTFMIFGLFLLVMGILAIIVNLTK